MKRFSDIDEIEQVLTPGAKNISGPDLWFEKARTLRDDSSRHQLILGTTGCGKTSGYTIQTVVNDLTAGESVVVCDSKKEVFETAANYIPEGCDWYLLNFRDPEHSMGCDPLELYNSVRDRNYAAQILDNLADGLFPVPQGDYDPYWQKSAADLLRGYVLFLFRHGASGECSLDSIMELFIEGENTSDRFHSGPDIRRLVTSLPADDPARQYLQPYAFGASDTRKGTMATFDAGISLFRNSTSLQKMLRRRDLRISELDGRRQFAVFILLPDEVPFASQIAGILITQLTTHMIHMAETVYDGVLPRRVNVILEELGSVGKSIPNLSSLLTAGRSRGVRLSLILQTLPQLDDIYGSSQARTIRSNCETLIAFRTGDYQTMQELSSLLGTTRKIRFGSSIPETVPILSPGEIGAMETGRALVMISGVCRFTTRFPDYTRILLPANRDTIRQIHTEDTEKNVFSLPKYLLLGAGNDMPPERRPLGGLHAYRPHATQNSIDPFEMSSDNSDERSDKKDKRNSVPQTEMNQKDLQRIRNAVRKKEGESDEKTYRRRLQYLIRYILVNQNWFNCAYQLIFDADNRCQAECLRIFLETSLQASLTIQKQDVIDMDPDSHQFTILCSDDLKNMIQGTIRWAEDKKKEYESREKYYAMLHGYLMNVFLDKPWVLRGFLLEFFCRTGLLLHRAPADKNQQAAWSREEDEVIRGSVWKKEMEILRLIFGSTEKDTESQAARLLYRLENIRDEKEKIFILKDILKLSGKLTDMTIECTGGAYDT